MSRLYILAMIVFVGMTLRTVLLDLRPLGFTWDEAALGYNAYSLLKTGKDEYGQALPIVFKSFGDFKPGLYIYMAVPWVRVLGLNERATRMTSAIAGGALIILIYLLARELLGARVAPYAALLLAINPWAIYFSRGAWETNLALFLTSLGSLLFVRRKYILAALFFGLTFWTYQGAKLFTPLIILSLIVIYRPRLQVKRQLIPLVLLALFAVPIALGLRTQGGRLKVFNVFNYARPHPQIEVLLKEDELTSPNLMFQAFHAEIIDQLRGVEQRYLNYFSPYFLFFAGDWENLRHSIAYYGYFHLPEMMTMVIGMVILVRKRTPGATLIFSWLFLAPVAAALSRDLVSGVRTLPLVIPLTLLSAAGLERLANKRILGIAFGILMAVLMIYYLDLYYIHSSYYSAEHLVSPYKPALEKIKQIQENYQKIVFTDKLGQPYIFALFYLAVDPKSYQLQSQLIENAYGDVGHVNGFDKFEFRPIYWPADRGLNSTLFVGGEYELPGVDLIGIRNLDLVESINYPNDKIALRIVGLK